MKKIAILILLLPALASLQGCSVLKDFKSPKFACGLPNGVGCKPVSDVYALSVEGRLGEAPQTSNDGNTQPAVVSGSGNTRLLPTVNPGDPILSRPRHIRVWLGRWEDKDGDLHDETYLYLRLDNGQWLLQ